MEIAEYDSPVLMYEYIESSSKFNRVTPRNVVNIDDIVLDNISDLDPNIELSVNVQSLLDNVPRRGNAQLFTELLPRRGAPERCYPPAACSPVGPSRHLVPAIALHNAGLHHPTTCNERMHLLLPNDIPADLTECNPDSELLQPPSQLSLDQYDVNMLSLCSRPRAVNTGVPIMESRCPNSNQLNRRNAPCSLPLVSDYVQPSHVVMPDMWETLSDSSNPSVSASTTPGSPVSDSCFSELGTPTSSVGSRFSMPRIKGSSKKRSLEKDSNEYKQRRERNNVAVRKSRDKTKLRHIHTESRVDVLANENDQLKKRVDLLTKELTVLKGLFTNVGIAVPSSLEHLLQNQ